MSTATELPATFSPSFSRWRHGGWYNHSARYPNGGCGCVSANYVDKKWRIVDGDWFHVTFSSRDDAAKAEYVMTEALKAQAQITADLLTALKELELRTRQFIAGDLVTFPAALLEQVRGVIDRAEGT